MAPAVGPSALTAQAVIGPDTRTQVNPTTVVPYQQIAHLNVTYLSIVTGTCTGWFVGPHTVMTAGHCVYDPIFGWATSVEVIPAKNGGTNPHGSQTVGSSALRAVDGWVNSGNQNFDYGAIILPNDNLGNAVGWFHYGVFSDTFLTGIEGSTPELIVTGYPADKTFGTMWTDPDPLYDFNANWLYYYVDTYSGQSGSPIWINDTIGAVAVAGHTAGSCVVDSSNCGPRYVQAISDNLQLWGAASPPLPDLTFGLGVISGTIFESDGTTPITSNANVCVEDNGGVEIGCRNANTDGTYEFVNLATGNYRIRADATGFTSEYYDNAGTQSGSATPVSVTAGAITPDIDSHWVHR